MRCNEIINTISPSVVDTMLIWCTPRGGIVLPQYVEYYTSQLNDNIPDTYPNTSVNEINSNRIEILKLLVTCCSSELYNVYYLFVFLSFFQLISFLSFFSLFIYIFSYCL